MKPVTYFSLSLLWLSLFFSANTRADAHATEQNFFVENKEPSSTPKSILFTAHQQNNGFFFRKDGVSYVLRNKQAFGYLDQHRIDLVFLNANDKVVVEGHKELASHSIFQSLQKGTNAKVGHYQEVLYKNIYNHVDLRYFFTPEKSVKYEFVVHPGGKVSDIQVAYFGQEQPIRLDSTGALVIASSLGYIQEAAPYSYQEGDNVVSSSYLLSENVLSFKIGSYDTSKTLIIDPSIVWSTYHGGSSNDYGTAIAHDAKNHLYMCGGTSSFNFPSSIGAHQDTLTGSMDAFISKFDSSGALVWSTYFGGLDEDLGVDILCGASGAIYVLANTSSILKTTSGSLQDSLKGASDAFIMKLNSLGELQWSTYFGGDSVDVATGISVDSKEEVVISGYTMSKNLPHTPLAHQVKLKGDTDGFVAKIDSSGTLRWATYLGGNGAEELLGICNDHVGNVYVTGFSTSTDFKTTAFAHQDSLGGKKDVITACLSHLGTLKWASYYGGAENDIGTDIVADDHRNVYVTGTTAGNIEIKGQDTVQTHFGGGTEDAFIISFERGGVLDFATYYGGSGTDKALAIDWYHKAVAISGYTNSGDLEIGKRSIQYNKKAGFDGFTLSIDTNGRFLRASYLGGAGADYLTDIKFYFGGQALTGYSLSNDYHVSKNAGQAAKSGGADAILTTLCPALFRYITGGTCNEGGFVGTLQGDTFDTNFPVRYRWQKRTLFDWKDIPNATKYYFNRDTIGQLTYYRRIHTGGMCTDTTIISRSRKGPVPYAGFQVEGDSCFGDTASFTNLSTVTSGGLTFKWFFEPRNTSTETHPKYFFNKADTTYAVRLKAISDSNCTSTEWWTVTLESAPNVNFAASNDCESDSTIFRNGTVSQYPYNLIWRLHNGDTSRQRRFKYLYPATDSYQVTLIASSNRKCSDTLTKKIAVDSNVQARFTCKNACTKDQVVFSNSSTPQSTIVAAEWILGDGDTSWTYQPNHAYMSKGIYTAQLVAFDKHGCTDTMSRPIQIIEPPNIAASALSSCETDSTYFKAVVTGADSLFTFTWDLGDGTHIKNLTDFPYVYKNYASYKVLFTAQSSSLFCTRNQELNVFHDSLLQVDFAIDGDCEKTLIRFQNESKLSSGSISWLWDFGDLGKSNIENPVHPYERGVYTVSLKAVSDSGCSDSVSKVITIHPSPSVSFTRDTACFGDSVRFRNTSTSKDDIAEWKWHFGDQNRDSTKHSAHVYDRGGTFQVRLVAKTVNGCWASTTKNVLQPFPIVAILDSLSPVSCYGITDGKLTVRAQGGVAPVSIFWPNQLPPSTQATISNLGAGTYRVNLEDALGCSLSQDFEIKEPDSLHIAEIPDITICENKVVELEAIPLGGTAPFVFTWSCNKPNCNFVGTNNEKAWARLKYNKTFTAVAIDSNGCKSAPQTVDVIVLPVLQVDAGPDLYALEGKAFQVHAECDTTCDFSWSPSEFFENHLLQSPFATLNNSTVLTVEASSEGTCPATDQVEVTVLKDLNFANSFTPNNDGVNDTWEIRNAYAFPNMTVNIYTRTGALLYTSKGYSTPWDGNYNGEQMPSGSYYYVIEPGNGIDSYAGHLTLLR